MKLKKEQALVLLALLSLAFAGRSYGQMLPRVELKEGEPERLRNLAQESVENVLQVINLHTHGLGDLEDIKQYCAGNGFATILQTVKKDRLYANYAIYRTNLVEKFGTSDYLVREIEVWAKSGPDSTKFLVFTVNPSGKITSLDYGITPGSIRTASGQNGKPVPAKVRREVEKFLERLRLAYCERDIDFLETVFAKNAKVTVGVVSANGEQSSGPIVRLIQKSEIEYLAKLKSIMSSGNPTDVAFQDIKIAQHPVYPELYEVEIYQLWNEDSLDPIVYKDKGFLYMLVEFLQAGSFKVHFRTWGYSEMEGHVIFDLPSAGIAR